MRKELKRTIIELLVPDADDSQESFRKELYRHSDKRLIAFAFEFLPAEELRTVFPWVDGTDYIDEVDH